MSKKRLLSALLAVLMVFVSIPLDTIKVQAGISGSEGLEYTYSGTTATVTGYSQSGAKTVERIIIPETVTNNGSTYTVASIAALALNSDDLPALKEVSVLGDNVEIQDNAFGKYKNGTTDTKVIAWCNKGSTAESYAEKSGLEKRWLNVQDLTINSPTSEYYTGCEPFEISTIIKAKSAEVHSSDIIWQTDNSELAWFEDGNGKKITEATGTLSDNNDGTTTVKIKVYVCDNEIRKSGEVNITATCRGTGTNAVKKYTIKKATKSITPNIKVYKPVMETDEKGVEKYKVINLESDASAGKQYADIVYEEVDKSELESNGYFINNTLYIDVNYGYVIFGEADEDSDDYISATYSQDSNTGLLVGRKFTNTIINGEVEIKGIVDNNGNAIDENIRYVAGTSASALNSTVTLFSQNKVLSKPIEIKACKPSKELKMYMGGGVVENGGRYSNLVQTTSLLKVEHTPSDSTDEVIWTSSDSNVAKINEGNNLYLNSPGTSKITCTVKDSKSGKRNLARSFTIVALAKVQYKEIVFAKDENRDTVITEKNIVTGSTYTPIICDARDGQIYIAGNTETAANEPLTFTSSDTSIATVENGVIKASATKTGTVRINVKSESGISNSITLRVYSPAEKIDVSTAKEVPEGQILAVPYSLVPATATEDVVWSSENNAIATGEDYIDDNGNRFLNLKGVATGSTTLIGRTVQSGTQVRVNVTVAPAVHADEVSMNLEGDDVTVTTDDEGNTVYNLPKGQKMYLTPVLKNSTGVTPNDKAEWMIEANQTVCSVTGTADNTITVTGNNAGKIFLTLKAYGGSYEKSVKCYINVYVPATKADIKLGNSSADEYNVEIGKTVTLQGTLTPSDSTDYIAWSVDNDNIELSQNQSVQNGSISMTAMKVGTTMLTARADSGVSDTVRINVIIPAQEIKFVQDGQEINSAYVTWKGKTTISINVPNADTTDTTFTWGSVTDNARLKITPSTDGKSAVIEGLAPGQQQIRVTAPSGKMATLNVNVVIPAETIELNNTELAVYKGDPAISVMATLSPSNTTDVVKWSVDKEDIVSITPDTASTTPEHKVVKIQGIGVGVVNVTATTVDGLKATIKINVSAKDVDIVTVSDIPVQTYSGREITPSFNVTNNNVSLRKDMDYKVSYRNNINAGKATIVIEGIGNYTGTKEVTFEIQPKNIASVRNNAVSTEYYNGNAHTPEIVLSDSDTELVNGKDYTVEYSNNIVVGTASAKFTGMGNYTGEKTVNFSIQAKNISESQDVIIEPIKSMTYTGSSITPNVIVKDGTKVLEKDKDYIVSIANNVNAGTATVTVTGRGNYNNSKTATFTINKRSLSKAKFSSITNQNYTGKAVSPYFSVTVSGRALSQNTDYTIKYSSNSKPGKATIKITGKGNYSSSASKTFIILPLAPRKPKMSANTSSSVTLTWSKATGATGYYVYEYSSAKGKPSKKVATVTKNTATIKKVASGADKIYSIYSYVKVGSKVYKSTNYINVTAGTRTKTPAIRKLTTSNSSVQLTWKAVTGAQGYQVYYATSKKGKYKKYQETSALSCSVTGLKAKRTYYFKIRTYKNIGGKMYYSSYSSVKAIKVKA